MFSTIMKKVVSKKIKTLPIEESVDNILTVMHKVVDAEGDVAKAITKVVKRNSDEIAEIIIAGKKVIDNLKQENTELFQEIQTSLMSINGHCQKKTTEAWKKWAEEEAEIEEGSAE